MNRFLLLFYLLGAVSAFIFIGTSSYVSSYQADQEEDGEIRFQKQRMFPKE